MSSMDDHLFTQPRHPCHGTIVTPNTIINSQRHAAYSDATGFEYELALASILGPDVEEVDSMMWGTPEAEETQAPPLVYFSAPEDSGDPVMQKTNSSEPTPFAHPTVPPSSGDISMGLESDMCTIFEAAEVLHDDTAPVFLANSMDDTGIFADYSSELAPEPTMLDFTASGSNDIVYQAHEPLLDGAGDGATFGWLDGVDGESSQVSEWLDMERFNTPTLPSTPTSSLPSGEDTTSLSGADICSNTRRQRSFEKIPCPNGCGRQVGGQAWHLKQHIESGKCAAGRTLSQQRSKENRDPTYQYEKAKSKSKSSSMIRTSEGSMATHRQPAGCSRPAEPAPAVQFDLDGLWGTGCPGVQIDWNIGNIFSTFPWQLFEREDLGFRLSHAAGCGNTWVLRLRSSRCDPLCDTGGTTCQDCSTIRSQKMLKGAEQRAKLSTSETTHLNTIYLTHAQSAAKLLKKQDRIEALKQTVST
ncbi:hypothetical protein PC9H_005813 [Pleurotus ostreatus]|uniref:Uncharacterized protein n=1 Tax=Pleurotus ostreatus TaxID=5322 RepID=A0A8H7A4L5_PLEOS|nr:uncharacterized protein PC9H_005813 [Pleurotus ostreatus]KAF7433847.1 hypothetical protein PC9H_005813 [Pleurotus ostreatus]KAJ8697349.1 hypothetical protein PTI98_004159 [Pleurotus ostreatus]